MSLQSRFFNSIESDRPYDATDWAGYFASLITNGVCHEDDLKVTTDGATESGYAGVVNVAMGAILINGYMLSVESLPESLTVPLSNSTYPRADYVVARLEYVNRQITLYVKTGSGSASGPTPPTLQRDTTYYELALARLVIPGGATSITPDMITDLRMNAVYCGLASVRFDGATDVTQFFSEWSAKLETLYRSIASELTENQAAWLQAQITNLAPYDFSVTLAAADWVGDDDGVYTQTAAIEAMSADSKCQFDLDMSSATIDNAADMQDDFALIGRGQCQSGALTFTCYGACPTVDLPIIVRVTTFTQLTGAKP